MMFLRWWVWKRTAACASWRRTWWTASTGSQSTGAGRSSRRLVTTPSSQCSAPTPRRSAWTTSRRNVRYPSDKWPPWKPSSTATSRRARDSVVKIAFFQTPCEELLRVRGHRVPDRVRDELLDQVPGHLLGGHLVHQGEPHVMGHDCVTAVCQVPVRFCGQGCESQEGPEECRERETDVLHDVPGH